MIGLLDSRNPEIGYNICHGGEGFTGEHTVEARKKIAEAARQMWTRPETREAIISKSIGHPAYPKAVAALVARNKLGPSEETRQKLIDSHTGLKRSLESREKQSQSISGTKNHFYGKSHSTTVLNQIRKPIRCIDTGDVFPSLLMAAQWAGWNGGGSGNLSRALKGRGNFLGKRFEYVQQLSKSIVAE